VSNVATVSTGKQCFTDTKFGIWTVYIFYSGRSCVIALCNEYNQFYAKFTVHFVCIFYNDVFLQNLLGDVSVKVIDMYIISILYIKLSSLLLFCVFWLKVSSGYMDVTAFVSGHNFCNIFWIIFHLIGDIAKDIQLCYLHAVWIYPHNVRNRK
jgi:hypothetical protein